MYSIESQNQEKSWLAPVPPIRKRSKSRRLGDSVKEKLVFLIALSSAVVIVLIFLFIFKEAHLILKNNFLHFVATTGFDQQIVRAYSGETSVRFGALGLIIGTLTTTLGALISAVITGLGTAIVITELAPPATKYVLQTVVRLLASIPSVIYGLIGLMIIVPFIRQTLITSSLQVQYINRFQLSGNSMLAGIVVLSIMIVPLIIALAVDAINAVPDRYREAGLSLGLSHWRTIVKIILPTAQSGIWAGIILAAGRAMGEAIALSMVSGGIGNIPRLSDGPVFFLTPVLTLASAIVNKSEIMSIASVQSALFACGVVLLVTSTFLSLAARVVEYLVARGEGLV